MSSNSSPPPATEPQQSQSAGNNTSPFRSVLENPRTLTSKQRSPRTPSYTSLTLSPQQPPRPSSVFPTLLGSLSPTPNTNAAATAITTTTATIVKIDHSQSPARSRKSNSVSPTPHPSNTATRPNTPTCAPSSPPSVHSSNGSASAAAPQQFCLRWNNYQSNLTSVFDQLLQNESFVDVTLACDGRSIKAHKMVLSACSPYFQMLFSDTPCRHPIVIMRDVSWPDLKAIVEFMYKGEINVSQEQIGPLLRIAEMLKVRGLADVNGAAAAGGIGVNVEQHESGERAPKVEPQLIASPRRRLSTASPELIGKLLDDSKLVADDRAVPDSFLSFVEPEKKLRMSRGDWDTVETTTSSSNNNLEMRLSPQLLHHHQQHKQVARNVRKRRWPSTDTIFNPPSSPLSGLIAAERAEREREREREHALMTPPITSSSSAAAHVSCSRLTPAVMHEVETPLDLPSPSPTPLPASRTPSAAPSSSPHLMHYQQQQQQHHSSIQHHTQQQHGSHHSHRSSPASSSTSNTPHPSSVLSNPLTPSPASTIPAVGHGDGRFPPLGHAQAAAMAAAAAAAQMDSMGLSGMGMSHHPSSIAQQSVPPTHHTSSIVDDMEIKPGIAEMIREEERVSFEYKHSLFYSFTK